MSHRSNPAESSASADGTMQREMELMRKEKELMQCELELTRREMDEISGGVARIMHLRLYKDEKCRQFFPQGLM